MAARSGHKRRQEWASVDAVAVGKLVDAAAAPGAVAKRPGLGGGGERNEAVV